MAARTSMHRATSAERHAHRRVSARELHRARHLHRPAARRSRGRKSPRRVGSGREAAGVRSRKRGTILLCTGHHARTFPRPPMPPTTPVSMWRQPNGWREQGIVHFGIDSMRPGPEGDINALVHKACLELDITHIESLCNLEACSARAYSASSVCRSNGAAAPARRSVPSPCSTTKGSGRAGHERIAVCGFESFDWLSSHWRPKWRAPRRPRHDQSGARLPNARAAGARAFI